MLPATEKIIDANLGDNILTKANLDHLFGKTAASRYGLINKMLKKGELIKLRRGLYILATKYRHTQISKFHLASRIMPHSYVSLESALSYHGWIPEKVVLTTSVTANTRPRSFQTLFGEFAYYYIPINSYEFLTSVSRSEIANQPFLVASPLRALADHVYVRKPTGQGLDFLFNSLRIEEEQIKKINTTELEMVKKVYRSKRVLDFLSNLIRELKL
ncbi:MAG: hypothetical protein KAT71_02430 [Gammaproteobacteria bacterium]|nr:hypothetical protein [Gammaproteobacteria bacterium]